MAKVDLSAPSYMRENASLGLKYLRDGFGGDGLTDGTKQAAREMSQGRISENKVRKMAAWFARHQVDGKAPQNSDQSDSGYPGPGLVAWLLWGGDSNFSNRAQDWAERKIEALNAESDNTPRSNMKKIERRTFTVKGLEARQSDDGSMTLAGYAAVFNESSVPLPFKETIMPGAFRKTLSETPDVRMLINHEGLPIARTKNGTMTLIEDERGLYFTAELADTSDARDIYALVSRGDVDQMSFAFRVIRQKWSEDRTRRILSEVSLADGDVSVVTYPAYPTTSVEARDKLVQAIEKAKTGRDITPEDMAVLDNILSELDSGHEYIMRAFELMSSFMGKDEAMYDDEDEATVETPETPIEDTSRKISLRLAQALRNNQ
jgi:HK97 family phage prohead protease